MNQNQTGAGLSAEEGVLTQAAATVAQAKSDVAALCSQLEGEINGLRGKWDGLGARSFAHLHGAWQDKQTRIVGALDTFAESLQDTDRDNTVTDQAQADASQLLTSRLG